MVNLLSEPFNPLAEATTTTTSEEYEKYINDLKRNEIRQIVKSYHQTYDHFHEAVQNCMDACEAAYRAYAERPPAVAMAPYEPHIQVRIDVDGNQLTICDNGIGMNLEEVQRYFFTPYATCKSQLTFRQRGEKGVGNTFLTYGSEHYHFSTRRLGEQNHVAGKLEGGIRWTLNGISQMPMVHPDNQNDLLVEQAHGTVVQIRFSEQTNIRRLADHGTSVVHWEAILRLQTGVGYIDFRENDDFLSKLKVSLYVTYQGTTESALVQKGYLYPHKVSGVTSVRKGDLIRGDRGRLPPRHTMKQCAKKLLPNWKVTGALAPIVMSCEKTLSTIDPAPVYASFGQTNSGTK